MEVLQIFHSIAMKRKKFFIVIVILSIILVVIFFSNRTNDSTEIYKVTDIPGNYKINDKDTLYVVSIPFSEDLSEEKMYLYYFSNGEQSNSNNFFVNPVFLNGKCVEEKYITGLNPKVTGSADGSLIFEKLFLLADKTSKDNPIYLFEDNGIVYGLIDQMAYVLVNDGMVPPDLLEIDNIREVSKKIVYQIKYDGSFDYFSY